MDASGEQILKVYGVHSLVLTEGGSRKVTMVETGWIGAT